MSNLVAEAPVSVTPLTLVDRCDSCSAAAAVQVAIGDLDLLFCGHHYNKNSAALLDSGAHVIQDNRSSVLSETSKD